MQATRFLVNRLTVDGVPLDIGYADLYVVVRDGEAGPGPTDWEAQAQGTEHRHMAPGRHVLGFDIADGSRFFGQAIVRFSDGDRHLFRGDGELSGYP